MQVRVLPHSIVPYTLPVGTSRAKLVAYDALGRQVSRQPVRETQGEVSLPVKGWPTGLYQLTLVANGQVLGSQRVAISHE